MDLINKSHPEEFFLLGFADRPWLELPLFIFLLITYPMAMMGNIAIILVSKLDPHLHSPMYFFLTNLSFLDMCYTTSIVPQMLCNLGTSKKTISYIGCAVQLYFFHIMGGTECLLLALMSFDRYVAICDPLRYTVLMGYGMCLGLVAAACACGFTVSLVTTSLVFHLPFHSSNRLHHFFCDISPVLKLAFALIIPLLLILVSYIRIISAILKIPSSVGRYKAFSTCASHLIVVTVHYGCASFIYLRPKSNYSSSQDTLISVSYTILTPLFNPMIYSLRNKEFKSALQRAMTHTSYSIN